MELEVLIPKECFCQKESQVELINGYCLLTGAYGTGKGTSHQADRGDHLWLPQVGEACSVI